MSIQRVALYEEAIAILAQTCAAEMGDPSVWRGLVKNAVEQARENLERDESALQRNQAFDLTTRIGYTCEGELSCSWQAGRTSK